MTDDSVGGRVRLKMHSANNSQAVWLREIAPDSPCRLIDVGGNVGLFTRQALIAVPNIAEVYIYEPDRQNYVHLQHNLHPWSERIIISNAALAKTNGKAEFFHDPSNSGNLSLLQSAMPPVFLTDVIRTVDASVESREWARDSLPIIYKSDTQGCDEAIATMADPLVWDQTVAAILEMWRIPKPAYDVDIFRNILSKFKTRRLGNWSSNNLSIDDVMHFASGADGAWLDLLLMK